MANTTDTRVTVTTKSDRYVDREELDTAIFELRDALEFSKKFSPEEINELLKDINGLVAPKRKETLRGKTTEVDNLIDVEIEIAAEDLLYAVYESQADEVWNFVAANFGTDAFVEEVESAGRWPKNFIPAIDFHNRNDFKRYICDVLEVGYHTDDWECVKGIACYINPDFKVL